LILKFKLERKHFIFYLIEKLAKEHADKVLRHEQEQEKFLKERQDTFEEAFNEQLREYKKTGSIPSKYIFNTLK
jgi:hypothetical protein